MKEKKGKGISVLLSVVLALYAMSASIAVPILWRGFYDFHIEALSLPEQTGYSAEEIREAYNQMMDFEWKNAPFGTGTLKWSEEGMQHFADVRVLFHLDAYVLLVTALLLVLYLLFRKKIPVYRFGSFPPAFFAGCGLIAFFGIVSALAATNFDRAFVVFHHLFFPGKTNWVFDENRDEIIRILPQIYFRNCAILAVALIACFCAGYIAYGIFVRRKDAALRRTRLADSN